jgi:hypothetical protein
MSRDLAPLSVSFAAIAIVVILGVMSPFGPATDEGADQPPVADAGPDVNATAGDVVLLDGSRSTDDKGIEAYTWTIAYGDINVTLEGTRVTHVFEEVGTYPIILNVTDSDGYWSTDVLLVNVW